MSVDEHDSSVERMAHESPQRTARTVETRESWRDPDPPAPGDPANQRRVIVRV